MSNEKVNGILKMSHEAMMEVMSTGMALVKQHEEKKLKGETITPEEAAFDKALMKFTLSTMLALTTMPDEMKRRMDKDEKQDVPKDTSVSH